MGIQPSSALMVGDDLRTDVGGAQAAGMRTALVRTGKFRQEVFEASLIRPDLLLPSIASLPEAIRETFI